MSPRLVPVYAIAFLIIACSDRAEVEPERDSGVDASSSTGDDAGPIASDGGPPEADAAIADDGGVIGDDAGPIATDAGPSDAGPADGGIACELGALCNDANPCPPEQVCYGSGGDGFCAPLVPECGGFAMIDCTAGRRCIRGGGSSLGYCATLEESYCICESARTHGITTDGCS